MLDGSITKASVYDRALSQSEINAIFHPDSYVGLEKIVNSLPDDQRNLYTKLITKRKFLEKRLGELEATVVPDKQYLQDLALALFNMKEFIYLK